MAFTGGDEHDDDGVDMVAWQEQMAEDEDQAVALLGGQEPGLCTFGNPKPGDNASNTYNHNFEGQFCHCNRPYPDDTLPEDVNEDMVQCVLCEDWFHTVGFDAAHADVPHPDSDSITHPVSFICGSGEDHDVAHRCKHGAFYHGIRQCICACQSCQQLFRERGVDFLHDEEDSQEHFDAIRRQRQQEEQARSWVPLNMCQVAARLMQQLPHRAQMELALAQQHFVQPVLQALRQLTRERQVDVITEDHVREITHAVLQRAQEQQQQQQQQQPQ
ncbi:hypothetical protein PTSG_07682 [Salpingoeca rosetta]|uniref:Uncharacterized protein n=1 Tax=Salpingoeca rosetta (strain ATCC 50818 / BSB-021) TaxID=946362 RepID=F2UHG7_SALR5|nr:uncharacterized protein PTSG_07682 [Salpingoeca rosetta]EGD76566.1 hypothetical protein PTSG_07682 [Salpingoeca rosetta]|eukprot:XP_004991480.1 hypothetical protein PTSG_07682 [Salpingoeca rosetta]